MRARLLAWLLALLKRSWVPFVQAACVVLLLAFSLDNAHWVPDDGPILICIYLGAVCGLLLAASRFPGGFAAGYSVLMALAALAQSIGRVIPGKVNLLPLDLLWLSHARLLSFCDRAWGWAAAIHNGQTIHDTGLFVFLIGLLGWNASAWLLWSVFRRRTALPGLLPYGFLLAINNHLSRQDSILLALFAALALLLAASTAFTVQNDDWDVRRVDYPWELGWEWSFSAAALALAVGLVAWAAPLLASPQGWQVLRSMVQVTRLHAANTADQLFSGVTSPRAYSPVVTVQSVSLEQIGAAPSLLHDTIMWVQVSDPPPPPPGTPDYGRHDPQYYWRSQIFSTYTGSGWQPAPVQPYLLENVSPGQAPPGRYLLKQHFEIVVPHDRQIFSVNQPVQVSAGINLTATNPDKSPLLQSDVSEYDVSSYATRLSGSELNSAPAVYPQAITRAYLQLPAGLPERVRALAQQISAGASTPFEKAVRIQNYLRLTYPDNINVRPPPPGRDIVDYFLFEAPGGFCSYYASAMAVMLRAEGVPARVASGYARGPFNYERGAYRVAASAAHAWVEVYFPGYDWVEFEPTPIQSAADYALTKAQLPANLPPARAVPSRAQGLPAWLNGLLLLAAIAAAVALVVFVPRRFFYDRIWGSGYANNMGGASAALYLQVRRALRWAGLDAPLSATPLEFLERHANELADYVLLQKALEQATWLYQRSIFSPHAPSPAELQAAQRCWRRAAPQWLKLWIARRTRRGRLRQTRRFV
jgi:transglutaminase-like putative cysteine protease